MPKIETPEEFEEKIRGEILDEWGDIRIKGDAAPLIAARDAAIRAESAALLKTCGDKIVRANQQISYNCIYDASCTLDEALAALKNAGCVNKTLKNEQEKNDV